MRRIETRNGSAVRACLARSALLAEAGLSLLVSGWGRQTMGQSNAGPSLALRSLFRLHAFRSTTDEDRINAERGITPWRTTSAPHRLVSPFSVSLFLLR